MNRSLATALGVGLAGAAAIMGTRAYRAGGDAAPAVRGGVRQTPGGEYAQAAADKLSELIRFRTVFHGARDQIELEEFTGFVDALERLFPAVYGELFRELVNGHGMLFTWPGSAENPDERDVVLMAHYDVVPVDPRDDWTHPGFSGVQDEGYVWGRGALDNKGSLVVALSAVESLINEGFRPAHNVYLFFGNNEETAGDTAAAAVQLLRERGVNPWLVLDEGGAVALEAFPGLTAPAAVVGVAEKGILDVELLVRGAGGHASTPAKLGPAARLAQAIVALEENPLPAALPEPVAEMLRRIGRRSNYAMRLVTENMWAFKPLVTAALGVAGDETRAMTRTTVAVTMLEGSKASNVLPATARAVANVRIAVSESIDSVMAQLRCIIDDPKVELRVLAGHEPSPVSAMDNEQFAALTRAVGVSHPDALVTPYIQTGATDARHFTRISQAVYRFSPLRMDASDRASLHAVNERVRISALGEGVVFYRTLLQGLN